ncbi:MAG: hypothetical protein ABSH19_00480 [Opitutales bacterium]|jgi:hypothetical protein
MLQKLKSLLRRAQGAINPRDFFAQYPAELLKSQTDNQVGQLLLQQHYRQLAQSPAPALPSFADVGFRQYSQYEEDGILLYLFSLLPPQTRTCLEICAGDGLECNTTNLIINHGWWGCLFDGDAANVERGRAFFAQHKNTFQLPPTFNCAWITAENVNQLIADAGLRGEIDLLSLDLDGVDYWIWRALDVVSPRIVVCEINNPIPPDQSLTVPYRADFRESPDAPDFRGASLAAMVKLGRSKGYRLVGTHRYGFNAFFIKNGLGEAWFPEVSPAQCARDPYTQLAQRTRWPKVKDHPWVSV